MSVEMTREAAALLGIPVEREDREGWDDEAREDSYQQDRFERQQIRERLRRMAQVRMGILQDEALALYLLSIDAGAINSHIGLLRGVANRMDRSASDTVHGQLQSFLDGQCDELATDRERFNNIVNKYLGDRRRKELAGLEVTTNVSMYQTLRHGEPTNVDGEPLQYDHQKLRELIADVQTKEAYDGSKCPNCGAGHVHGEAFEPSGDSLAYRNCHCGACDARWTEELVVRGYDHLEVPEKGETPDEESGKH